MNICIYQYPVGTNLNDTQPQLTKKVTKKFHLLSYYSEELLIDIILVFVFILHMIRVYFGGRFVDWLETAPAT